MFCHANAGTQVTAKLAGDSPMITETLFCSDCKLRRVFQWDGKSETLYQACPRCKSVNIIQQGGTQRTAGFPHDQAMKARGGQHGR
jgi:phage FluMu protein Com